MRLKKSAVKAVEILWTSGCCLKLFFIRPMRIVQRCVGDVVFNNKHGIRDSITTFEYYLPSVVVVIENKVFFLAKNVWFFNSLVVWNKTGIQVTWSILHVLHTMFLLLLTM